MLYRNADTYELAAAYGFGLAKNHPFIDGNKRTSLIAMFTFLQINNIHLHADEDEAFQIIMALANGGLDEAELAIWLRTNSALIV